MMRVLQQTLYKTLSTGKTGVIEAVHGQILIGTRNESNEKNTSSRFTVLFHEYQAEMQYYQLSMPLSVQT